MGVHTSHPQSELLLPRTLLQTLLAEADVDQVRMMEERVICTDYFDNCVGAGSKKESEFRRRERSYLHPSANCLQDSHAFLLVQRRVPARSAAHLMTNINAGMLHRAFSVFLFTPDGKLVLQQVRES